jgi:hypothetical protein
VLIYISLIAFFFSKYLNFNFGCKQLKKKRKQLKKKKKYRKEKRK